MMLATGWSRLVSKRRSRLVTMPTTLRAFQHRQAGEFVTAASAPITSRTDIVGGTVIGSLTTPLSKRLTLATSAACLAGDMFLWRMPRPPSCAIAMARRASVTVSIAAETSGMLRVIDRVRRVARATSRGTTRECAGTSRTSSKVSAFRTTRIDISPLRKTRLYPRRPLLRSTPGRSAATRRRNAGGHFRPSESTAY